MEQDSTQKGEELIFANKKTSLQKAGEFIKEARQGRSLSIEDLSNSLRIGQEQLIALEKGDERALPEKVFIKAMIRRIAEKLQLDINFIIEELEGREKTTKTIYKSTNWKRKDINENENNTSREKLKQRGQKSNHHIQMNLSIDKFTPFIILTSGILGIMASLSVLNYINTSKENVSQKNYQQNQLIIESNKLITKD